MLLSKINHKLNNKLKLNYFFSWFDLYCKNSTISILMDTKLRTPLVPLTAVLKMDAITGNRLYSFCFKTFIKKIVCQILNLREFKIK